MLHNLPVKIFTTNNQRRRFIVSEVNDQVDYKDAGNSNGKDRVDNESKPCVHLSNPSVLSDDIDASV